MSLRFTYTPLPTEGDRVSYKGRTLGRVYCEGGRMDLFTGKITFDRWAAYLPDESKVTGTWPSRRDAALVLYKYDLANGAR